MKYQQQRFYRLRYLEVVVTTNFVVVSRHRLRHQARKQAQPGQAALALIGNPTQDYRPGMTLHPKDIDWRATSQGVSRCSECLQQYRPDSLNFTCPISLTPCDVVQHHVKK